MKLLYPWGLLLVLSSAVAQQRPAPTLWRTAPTSHALPASLRQARTLRVDAAQLQDLLATAPNESRAAAGPVLPVPLPDGGTELFRVWETPVLHPALAAAHPGIRTYAGQSLSNPSVTARFDLTPLGFHAQVLDAARGRFFIDPVPGATDHYRSFAAADRAFAAPWRCRVADAAPGTGAAGKLAGRPAAAPYGTQLRTYRLALACTGQYAEAVTSAAGASLNKTNVLSAMATAVNRVTGIYEQELAIRLQLVANNASIIYLDGASDPYSNNDGNAMLDENRDVVGAEIGSANYDIGHVFSTGGGGIAGVGVVCRNNTGNAASRNQKARGVTGLTSPLGDAFYVDYVAHEMGHQFGANHTFNSVTGLCGGNRHGPTAVEAGSGSSIMAYAGLCESDNLQAQSEAFFHAISQDEIQTYLSGNGSCASAAPTGNAVPTANAGPDLIIPKGTPFTLTGSGTDADPGTVLTYSWEQLDAGSAGSPGSTVILTSPTAAQFRSFAPGTSPTRTLPKMATILGGTDIGEDLPQITRTLNFRLTVRDNRPGGGGVSSDNLVVNVSNLGPFFITNFNTPVTLTPGATATVEWAVNGTTAAPLNVSTVDILFSQDGGQTFTVLLSNTLNDGSQAVQLPNVQTTTGRFMVRANGNVFFDVNDAMIRLTVPLPISLVAFDARRKATGVQLTWTTAQEQNNRGFEVQAQGPGDSAFRTLAFVEGAGQSNAARRYSHHLSGLKPGRWHLRLHQLDFDGSSSDSDVRTVDLQVEKAAASLYPNPAADLAVAALGLPEAATASLLLCDALGCPALTLPPQELPAGWHQLSLDVRQLPAGLYTWQLRLSNEQVLRGKLQVLH
ncbi:zinc-dependent metalloprotease family protein [Hymenobacter coalescens]